MNMDFVQSENRNSQHCESGFGFVRGGFCVRNGMGLHLGMLSESQHASRASASPLNSAIAAGHFGTEYFPNTSPPEPVPAALTTEEAIRYLRLDVGKTPEAAHAVLRRLVEKGLLRPCMYKKQRMFTRDECDRFLREQTERYRT